MFTDKFIREADNIFDEAEKIAESDEIKMRVEMARLPLMYLKCLRNPVTSQYNGTYELFNTIVKREGIRNFAELGKPHVDDFHNRIKNAK